MEAAIKPTAGRDAISSRSVGEGHGRRLTRALEALEVFPALLESRDRLLRTVGAEQPSTSDMVATVESDPALAISVLRLANRRSHPRGGKVVSLREGVEILGPAAVEALAARADVFDFFERTPTWDVAPDRFRLHAIAVQRAADRIAREVDHADRDGVLVAALLHDVGKLVLVQAYPGYPERVHGDANTAEERIRAERLHLGVDHALVGGVLARRWQLPVRLASTIERHHSDEPHADAAIVRLADMVAAYVGDQPVDPKQLLSAARAVGLSPRGLRAILYELPFGTATERRHVDPCPLSGRELEILKRLAEGKVYKQIASEIGLSTSTVRTHLHNTYAKLGAVDRAQAVLLATQRGWL
ncbi:MAG: HDOD domain-containing protein [Actinomycetota bacterium]|nr:HDOD domain-containing protein [Actinomycetota bacterium]